MPNVSCTYLSLLMHVAQETMQSLRGLDDEQVASVVQRNGIPRNVGSSGASDCCLISSEVEVF